MAVGIFEKSRRLRKARFSFGMLDSSRLVDTRLRHGCRRKKRRPSHAVSLGTAFTRNSRLLRPRSEKTSRSLPVATCCLATGLGLARNTDAGVGFRFIRELSGTT